MTGTRTPRLSGKRLRMRVFCAWALFAPSGACMLVGLGGCSPPPPSSSADDLAVEMPGDKGASPVTAPIKPPYLSALGTDEGQSEDSTQLVQKSTGSGAEIVPRPSPDGSIASEAEKIPTPTGAPEKAESTVPGGVDGVPGAEERVDQWRDWPTPSVVLVVTGQQNGYIEPCGCTGLDRQKGGIARRYTFMQELRDKGWPLLAVDAGNQVRRFGRQAEVKLQQTVKALKMMDYKSIGFGPDDLRLGVGELLAVAAADSPDDTMFASGNVVLIDPSLMPQVKVVTVNGVKVGIASILDPAALESEPSDDITVAPKEESALNALTTIQEGNPDFRVLMFYGAEEVGKKLAQDVPGYDLLVVAGGYGEPTYQPEQIEGTNTRMIVTGYKGMYAGLVGIFQNGPFRYARVPLTDEFEDAPEMRQIMKEYQDQLRDIGLEGLGLLPPIPHASGQRFVGTAKCGECHTSAFDVWQGTPHSLATDHIVEPPKERGDIARHFDPECLSCHVTGWNPQEYYPYLSGYLSLEESSHLTGNGCENCHGPGSDHSAAEVEGADVSQERRDQLRDAMKLPLAKAKEKCLTCHDLDNSPDFHEEDAFEDIYWPEVEHYGMD